MWLSPLLGHVANAALRIYYRLHRAGGDVPKRGPALLVANHPNSLLDPAMVAVAARRPVRFLAKAPLFSDRLVGWLVRGAGSIPVYRRSDDPTQVARNDETFRAVCDELARGAAVGIFPEGLSHSDPSLAPLKTGAARILLGTHARHGIAAPVIPVGLLFREKNVFRSEALLLVGKPVAWEELASRGPEDVEAVREVTRRIEDGLREVTVNLEQWDDAPLVEYAEAIYAAEFGRAGTAAEWIARVRATTDALRRLRQEGTRWEPLAKDISRHARILNRFKLRPADLGPTPRSPSVLRWVVRRLPLIGFVPLAVLAVGTLLFYPPYRLTGVLEKRARPEDDVRATHKLLTGAILFPLWIALLATIAGVIGGAGAAITAALLLPAVALATLGFREQWMKAREDAARYFTLRSRDDALAPLREKQRELAVRLRALYESLTGTPSYPSPAPQDPQNRAPASATSASQRGQRPAR